MRPLTLFWFSVPDVNVPMSPPPVQRPASAGARRSLDQAQEGGASGGQPSGQQPVSNIDALIEELAATVAPGTSGQAEPGPAADHSYAAADTDNSAGPGPANQEPVSSVWRRRHLVAPGIFRSVKVNKEMRKELGTEEAKFYAGEKEKGRQMFEGPPVGFHEGVEVLVSPTKTKRGSRVAGRAGGGAGGRSGGAASGRSVARTQAREEEEEQDSEDSEEEDHDFNHDSVTDSSLTESDLEEPSDAKDDDSSDYSDWGDNNLTPPQRTAKKSAKAAPSRPASSDDEEDDPKPGPSRYFKRKKYNFDPRKLDDIPKAYWPSSWLAESIPKKSPYFPQMGDEVMYFKQGHMGYIGLVTKRKCYKLNMKEQQWKDRSDLGSVELVKVVGMKYELRPPRLCCLKLAVINQSTNQLTGQKFSIKYHDMEDVVDFLVLRHIYDASINVTWTAGDRYRCQIEDNWWYGTVLGVSAFDPTVPESPFLSIMCLWDSGEEERLSPWDLDMIPEDDHGQEKVDKQIPVTKEEIERHIYQPLSEEWRGLDSKAECERISRGLGELMALAHAENFNYPVDLTAFPDYMLEIDYPMDFSLIKSRLDNHFYRRLTAVQFDVRYIATNAECYNRPKTEIVKCARILTDLVLMIIQNQDISNISREWHKLYESFDWADTQEASKKLSKKQQKTPPNPKQWKHDCMELLKKMSQMPDSEPFREPVDEEEFPDYNRVVTYPMDLSLVKENLTCGEYNSPLDLQKDILLIFSNSLKYNTNKNSEVLRMTKRLKEFFLDEFHVVITDWRKMNRRIGCLNRKGTSSKRPPSTPSSKKTPSKKHQKKIETDESSAEEEEKTAKPNPRRMQFDSSDDEKPVDKGKGKGKGKGKSSTRISVPQISEAEEEAEVDEAPLARRRNKPRSKTKTVVPRPEISSESEEEEEELEDTPEETTEEEDVDRKSGSRGKRRNDRRRTKESRNSETSDPGEGTSRSIRPKRSARAKVVRNMSEEDDDDDEEKVPYKRSSTKTRVVENQSETEEEEDEEDDKIPYRRNNYHKKGRVKNDSHDGRPLRQATKKALRSFQEPSEEEEDETNDMPEPRGSRRQPRRNMDHEPLGDGEALRSAQRRGEIAPDRGGGPSRPARRTFRPVAQQQQPSPRTATVTISAADSSTDHVRVPGAGSRSRAARHGAAGHGDTDEDPAPATRPQRKRMKPARLMEYEHGEQSTSRAGARRASGDSDRGRQQYSRDERIERSRNSRRQSHHAYEERNLSEDSEDEVLSRRRLKSNRRLSSGSSKKRKTLEVSRKSKSKRARMDVNYKDLESEDEDEEDDDDDDVDEEEEEELPRTRRMSTKKFASKNNRKSRESSEDDRRRNNRSKSTREGRHKSKVSYHQESESSSHEDDLTNPGAEEQETPEEEDLGRRRGSRRRLQIRSPRNNFRPQVR